VLYLSRVCKIEHDSLFFGFRYYAIYIDLLVLGPHKYQELYTMEDISSMPL